MSKKRDLQQSGIINNNNNNNSSSNSNNNGLLTKKKKFLKIDSNNSNSTLNVVVVDNNDNKMNDVHVSNNFTTEHLNNNNNNNNNIDTIVNGRGGNIPQSANNLQSSDGRCGRPNLMQQTPNRNYDFLYAERNKSEVDYDKLREFKFERPTECPVFTPTLEEFNSGPLNYIKKIRDQAEPYGICKIIPPKEFQVPFSIKEDKFRFKPRFQRINDLEASSRIRLNFTEKICNFWKKQGKKFLSPLVGGKSLDIYQFHLIVKEEGGFELITKNRKWAKIASRMNYNAKSCSTLKQIYEKYLFPYDVFLSGATTHPDNKNENEDDEDEDSDDNKNTIGIIENNNNNNNNSINDDDDEDEDDDDDDNDLSTEKRLIHKRIKREYDDEPMNSYGKRICFNCNFNNNSHLLLTCDSCEKSFHKDCLIPPFQDVPKKEWNCHNCLKKLLTSTYYTTNFGFVQSHQTYSLKEFGKMADEFKKKYFNRSPKEVPFKDVEKEFWRIVSIPFDNVINVEYGADLHTNDYGSGFPTLKNSSDLPEDKKHYIRSPWNLNNLPTLQGSVFEYISTNIDGMVVPWMYVGMCFSAFCWHNEDHWTYSINYLHWGEPKTWYGIPGSKAEEFEKAIRNLAPELFDTQPDLLHQLVTTCNPNLLTEAGVPVYRTDQMAGEFVVTFPRSYHAGFNQGFNFAEAVNFATADWLPMGRLSISNYSMLKRYPVFSHDELICKLIDCFKDLDPSLSKSTYEDFKKMVRKERKYRAALTRIGLKNKKYSAIEGKSDDERQCFQCFTTCFLSALKCSCEENDKMVCIFDFKNFKKMCKSGKCTQHDLTLFYKYTLDELYYVENLYYRKLQEKLKNSNGFH